MTILDERTGGAEAAEVDTMLIDTDVHEIIQSQDELLPYMAEHWRQYLRDYNNLTTTFVPCDAPYATPQPRSRLDWMVDGEEPGTSVEIMRKQLLDGEGVDVAVLNGFLYPSLMVAGFEYAQALASAYNDYQAEHWLDQDSRLRGSIQVVAHDPELAVKEIKRMSKHPQMAQVFLPVATDRQYGDPMYRPIFEAAIEAGMPVTLHHHMNTRTAIGYPRYYSEWHVLAAPHAAQCQMTSLIFNGIFERYPELKVVFLELGAGWVPWYLSRADENYREFRHETPWMKRLPSEYVRDHIRFSTQPLTDVTTQEFVRMNEEYDISDVFLFSTDYPHFDSDSADAVLPPGRMPEDLRRKVRFENAVNTYPRFSGLA